MTDRHVRRTADDYTWGLASLLPVGSAWPRYPDSVLMRVVAGLAQIWGQVDAVAADLLERESDPRSAIVLLPDWERAFGLPDRCLAEPLTIVDRQRALLARMTLLGAQSPAFFVALMEEVGHTINVFEHSPYMAGISRCGDTRPSDPDAPSRNFRWELGGPSIRFYWAVNLNQPRLSWFRTASGQAGVDPHLRISIGTDIQCLLNRYKPAHSDLRFDFSGQLLNDPLAGTP